MYKKPEIETQVIKPKMSTKFDQDEFRLITQENEDSLDNAVRNIESFITYNNAIGQSEEQKDLLYAEAKRLWENYVRILKDTKLTLYLNSEQFLYFSKMLMEDIEYDNNTIFFGIELTGTLSTWVKQEMTSEGDEIKSYDSDPVSFNYINHLISTVKVKGLTPESYLFSQVLRKVTEIMKVVNFYDSHAKSLSKDIQEWVANFEQQGIPHPNYTYQ